MAQSFVWGTSSAVHYTRQQVRLHGLQIRHGCADTAHGQGFILFPLSAQSLPGGADDLHDTPETVQLCLKTPEKCRNQFDLLQISGGFDVGAVLKARPDEEISTVSWALVHSKVARACNGHWCDLA